MQQLGLIALILLIPLGIIIPRKWPLKRGLSVSENIARHNASQLFFSLAFTPVTILYYSFLALWLGPHYNIAVGYYYILLIAFVAQLILTWVPARGRRLIQIHTNASYIVAIAMLAITGLILFGSRTPISLFLFIASWLFLAMGLTMTFIYLLIPKARKDYVVYELVYFLSFWIFILLLTYL
jgi:hypothetical protein